MADNIQTQNVDGSNSQISNTGDIGTDVYVLTQNNCDLTTEAKEDITPEELAAETKILEHPINWTDPIVWHDPTIDTGVIVKLLSKDIDEDSSVDSQQTGHNIDAIYFPLIKVNQHILANDEILYMRLESLDILPKLYLRVLDKNGEMLKTNSTGLNNHIIIVITAPVNGVYKKIKLQFYITDVKTYNDYDDYVVIFTSVLKIPELTHNYPTSMGYPNKKQFSGCSKCKQSENTKPNSWEMLHFIANHCKLGFASTKKCKDISDRSYRLFNAYSSLEECLYKEKEFAGTTEEEAIFDWWVDFYCYLVMVNVPYVLDEDISIKHLGIYGIAMPKATTEGQENPEPKPILVNRTLTNSRNTATFSTNHNLTIREYKIVTDNSLYNKGTCTTNNIFMPKGAGGQNGFDMFDIQVQELSVAGKELEKYTTKKTYLRGIDMSGFGKYQKASVFAKYFQKRRAKKLIVELENHNLGLQRGTLVNIVITEDNPRIKSIIMNNPDNMFGDVTQRGVDDPVQTHPEVKTTGSESDQSPSNEDVVQTEGIETINWALSGLYYIDGITFEFDAEKEQRIFQKLTLIKKGALTNYSAPNAPLHINKNITGK